MGTIFRKAQHRIHDPAKLKRLIIDPDRPGAVVDLRHDIKGDAYEALLSKGASDKGSGAGST